MKKMGIALTAAFIMIIQVFSLAAAAPLPLDSEKCGRFYTVQNNDNLYSIAGLCETTVDSILELNPQLEANKMIYAGQVLRLAETAPAAYLPTYSGFYKSDGSLRVSLSAVKVKAGEDFRIYVSGFPAGSLIDYRVSQFGETFSVAYEGNVDLEGNAGMTISIPSNANVGETWIIRVQTISEAKPVKILSPKIFIVGYMYADTKNTAAKVTLDRTQVKPGGTLKVSVSGFPINSHIDYRVGEYGKPYSLVYDGIVDAEGNASQIITIPLSAEKGKLWVVHVQTTSHVVGVDVTSATIKIIE